jgi:predicted helicase
MIKLNPLFGRLYTSWKELEQAIYELPTAHEKGEVFEEFVYSFLLLNKEYYQIENIYRDKDMPLELRKRLRLENTDYGVDGVFQLSDGTVAAYQAKFRDARGSATVRELATFWAESSRADHKYVIANATNLPTQADKHSYSILADKFDDLNEDFFVNLKGLTQGAKPVIKKVTPDSHQERMITNTLKGLNEADRGKLIAACGAGKTLISLWIAERMNSTTVLFLAPSLALIKQTLEAWHGQSDKRFAYLCVCSDESVVDAKELDYGEYDISEIDFPVTTDPSKIRAFLSADIGQKFVFSTYNSAQMVAEAMGTDGTGFDLIIFDEAHRTAGQKDSNLYSVALHDSNIPAKKRLFMTATERLVRPWIVERAAEADRVVFSMDNEEIYGKLLDRYSFGEAINDGVITDYRIVLTAVTTEEVAALIQDNRLLISTDGTSEFTVSADNIFKQVVLLKAMRQLNLRKSITFHSSVKRAKAFINGSSNESMSLADVSGLMWPESQSIPKYLDWVDGKMSAGLRKLKLKDFEASELGIVSNAKCLTEGIDVPLIDSIYFVDPKNSLVDIVQACGRALRKSRRPDTHKDMAYFIVPIIFSSNDDIADLADDRFETLLNLVQALRNQDERLADWIERINLGRARGTGGGGSGDSEPISIDLPEQFDLSKFTEQVELKILEANHEPNTTDENPDHHVRKSSATKTLTPIGDYSFDSMFSSLVDPTIEKFLSPEEVLTPGELKINNNNVSHTRRLNLIEKSGSNYKLTKLGKKYLSKEIDVKEICKSAMLNHKSDTAEIYPYRVVLQVLLDVGSVNSIEFLYGLYALQDDKPESVSRAKEIIQGIRESYPDIFALQTIASKEHVVNDLNEKYNCSYTFAEVWRSTTTNNKFIYFKSHLSLFDGVSGDSKEIVMISENQSEIKDMLEVANSGLMNSIS